MFKMNKNFVLMWLPVMAFILGAVAVRYESYFLYLVAAAYAFCLVVNMLNVKTLKPKEAADMMNKPWPQDESR